MKKLVSIILAGVLCMSSFAEVVFANDNNIDVSDVCDENTIEHFDDYNSEDVDYGFAEDETQAEDLIDESVEEAYTGGIDEVVNQEQTDGYMLVLERNDWDYYLDRVNGILYRERTGKKEYLFKEYYVTNVVYNKDEVIVIMHDSDFKFTTAQITNNDEIIYNEDEIELFEKSNETKIFEYCVGEMGLNVAAACAVLANIKEESTFRPDLYGDKGTSYGICQWHNGRFTNLKKYCKKNNLNWKSLNGQLKFLQYELSHSYKKVWNKLNKTKNNEKGARDAAKYWCTVYEIPANKEQKAIERGNLAVDTYWKKYKNYSVTIKTADNLVYPTKKVKFSSWTESGFVHDIPVSKGTPVYAIADGKIKCSQKYAKIGGKNKLVSYANLIEFTSSDKTVAAKYAHLDSFTKCNSYIASDQTAAKSASQVTVQTKNLGTYNVKKGEIIGYSGRTGNVHSSSGGDGAHLHFELRVNGKRVNPPKYLSTSEDDAAEETNYKKSNKYPTPLKCYTISKSKVTTYYGTVASNKTGWIDGKKDECTVKEFYTNGYAKVTYSGVKGFAYVPTSALISNPVSSYNSSVTSNQTIYKRSDLKDSYGTINSKTKIKVVGEKDGKVQIIVPTGKNYKLAWINKSKLKKNNTDDIITVNTSNLKTPITTYTIETSRIPTYSKLNGKSDGYIDGAKDLCVIKEICNNGWVKVTYPTDNGKKTAYAKASAFAEDLYTIQSTKAKKNQKVYRRENMKDSIGEVYKNDTVQIVDINGDKVQVVYPVKGGYKMGWMKTSNLQPVVSSIKIASTDTIKVVQNQTLNTGLFSVIAEYIDGSEKTLTYSMGLMDEADEANGYEILDSEYDEIGEQTLIVSHTENGITVDAELPIEIVPASIIKLQIASMPNKTNYIEGEELVTEGLSVQALYSDNTAETITDYNLEADEFVIGNNTVNISFEEFSTSFTINVVPKTLESISVKTMPNKITYVQGQEFDSTGLVLTAKYNNGDEEDITADYTCSELDTNSIGLQNIAVSYEGQTTQLSVEVVAKQPSSISVSQMPNNTSVIEGTSDIDTTGMKLLVKYNDNSERIIEGGFNVVGFEPYAIGTQTLKVNYCGLETTMEITVKEKTLTELKIIEPAEKLEFIEGEELITSGLVIYGYYDNGDVDEVTDYEISGYNANVGSNTVTVSYQGLSVTYDVDVKEKQLTGIEITSLPTKTEYVEGEALDLTGLQVTAVYDNGEQTIIPENDYSIEGFSNTPGQHAVSVSYNGVAAVFDVTVNVLNIETLSLVSKPNKLTYELGEELDLNGIEISAKYTNGNIENVDISDCTISGYNKENAGVQTVVAEYRDTSVCFVVNVKNIVDTTAILKIGRAYGVRGANITVPANIVNNTGISKFKIDITYDKSLFSACEAVPTDLIKNGTFLTSVSSETDEYITQTIEWIGNEEITKNGNVFNLNFRISETVEFNSYPIEISYYKENTANKNGELVDFNCMEGSVTVEEGDAVTRIVTAEQASVVAGGIINYNISLDNNTGLSSYKLNIAYDNTAMKLVNISGGRQFADFDVNYIDNNGTVTVTGLSNGISRQNGTLLKLEMKTNDDVADGNYPITLSYVADETYYLNNDTHENVILKTVDGEIAVSGYVLGDINGDGKVNNFDVMALVGYVNSDKALDTEHLLAADITGDGVVDYLDYASLSAYIIGLYENLDSDSETVGGSLSYKSNFVGGANHEKAVVVASEIFDAEIGEEVSMDFDLSRNPGMSGYVISLKYDTNVLELIDIKQSEALSGGKFSVNTSIDGDTTVMWSDDSVHNENGTIFNAIFKVKKALTDESLVQIQYNSEHTGYIDEDFSPVPVDLMSESGAVYPSESNAYLTISDVVRCNTEISGKITLHGVDTMNENAQLYVASYDNGGALITVDAFDINFDKGDCYDEEFKIKAEKINTIEKIKAFVWDRTDMHPLVKSKTYRP